MLRLPSYLQGAMCFGFSILLAWTTVRLVIAVLPLFGLALLGGAVARVVVLKSTTAGHHLPSNCKHQ